IELAFMRDPLEHLGTEFEILSFCFLCPVANPFFTIYFIMSDIKLDRIIMLYVMLQEILLSCFIRIDLSHPFRSSPLGTSYIYFRNCSRLATQYFLICDRFGRQTKIDRVKLLFRQSSKLHKPLLVMQIKK